MLERKWDSQLLLAQEATLPPFLQGKKLMEIALVTNSKMLEFNHKPFNCTSVFCVCGIIHECLIIWTAIALLKVL